MRMKNAITDVNDETFEVEKASCKKCKELGGIVNVIRTMDAIDSPSCVVYDCCEPPNYWSKEDKSYFERLPDSWMLFQIFLGRVKGVPDKEIALQLRKEGKSIGRLAYGFGKAKSTIHEWVKGV